MTTKALDTCSDTVCTKAATYSVRPRARVYENEDSYLLDIEMPGVSETDAEITIHRNELKIAGDSEDLEFRYERRFKLPETIKSSGVTATMQFGILKLALPKLEEAKPRTIKVIAG